MQRFKNILLVFDQNKETLRRAAVLAKHNRARLTVVGVIGELPRDRRMLIAVIPSQELERIVVEEQQEQLNKFIAPLRKQRMRVSTDVLIGRPFREIIRQVVRKKLDLVIMTAEGKVGLKERLFGSTSMHLMRKCPCPVWVMKPTRRKRYARIVVAVDPESSNQESNLLNVKIMELATSLAQRERSELHIVHAWKLYGEQALSVTGRVHPTDLRKWLREEEKAHRKRLDLLLQKFQLDDLKHRVHLVKGDAAAVIAKLVSEQRADLLVMGTISRTGTAGFFIGNTAEKVLLQVDCSVLTVKPDSFVTPVK